MHQNFSQYIEKANGLKVTCALGIPRENMNHYNTGMFYMSNPFVNIPQYFESPVVWFFFNGSLRHYLLVNSHSRESVLSPDPDLD